MADEVRRYHGMDLMRGVAALLVAAYHLEQLAGPIGRPIAGYLAVDMFFVLSGFVIALNYSDRMAHGLTAARFIEVRLIRLYPLHLAGWAVGILSLAVAGIGREPRALAWPELVVAAGCNLAMLPTPLQSDMFPLNGPAWSLLFEMIVSALFGLWLWRARNRTVTLIAAAAGGHLIATLGAPDFFNIGWSWSTAPGGLARALFAFAAGLLIFRHVDRSTCAPSWCGLVPTAVLVAVILADPPQAVRATVELAAVLVVFPLLVCAAIRWEVPPNLRGVADALGSLSYPVYALHWPLIPVLWPMLAKAGSPVLAISAYFAILIALSALVAHFYDGPVRHWLRARSRTAPTAACPAPAL